MNLSDLPRPAKTLILMVVDAILATAAYWLATIARYGRIPSLTQEQVVAGTLVAAVLMPLVALALGLYSSVTRFHAPNLASRAGVVSAICGGLLAAIALAGGAKVLQAGGFGFVFALVFFTFLLTSRAAARWILGRSSEPGIPVAIYGAGAAGRQLAVMLTRGGQQRAVVFIDDDPKLRGRSVEGLKVLHPSHGRFRDQLLDMGVGEILVAIPSLKPGRRRQLLEFLSTLALRVRTVPGLADLVARGGKGIGDLEEVSVDDLLGRDPVMPLPGLLDACIRGKTVLVTGGGGSIGSELCRQALAHGPKRLIVLDHSEFALYSVEHELGALAASIGSPAELDFVLGSATDQKKIEGLFAVSTIDTVYHAAAYKHVPIVEKNPVEGFRNNVFGTLYIARAAAQAKVGRFVLISSDKAVRPTNVMGATKRVAELVVELLARRHPGTIFSMVRFGNVLASSGSVVPLFSRQIAAGGPITLTHADVTRYFMTIREAVELVIQAGSLARGGELFVLDMGTPVRIRDLAERMIRLSGRSVRDERNSRGDIAIEVTGLRPGEKLHEELLIDGDATGTAHPRIWELRERPMDLGALESELERVESGVHDGAASTTVHALLARWVAGFPGREVGVERKLLCAVPLRATPETWTP